MIISVNILYSGYENKFEMEKIPTIINTNKLIEFHYYKYNSVVIRLTLSFIIRYLVSMYDKFYIKFLSEIFAI